MCGRFTLTDTDPGRLRLRFELPATAPIAERARYNIAPTDPVLAIRRSAEGEREAGRLRWGLVPGGWALESGQRPLINARAETAATQPAFAESFRSRRCLIAADGFYEWRVDERGKQPVWIGRVDGEPFAFAGIWAEHDVAGEEPLTSCALITCEPNELVRPIHERMPVILAREREAQWLDPEIDPEALGALLGPIDGALLSTREVGNAVNDVRADGPQLLEAPLRLL